MVTLQISIFCGFARFLTEPQNVMLAFNVCFQELQDAGQWNNFTHMVMEAQDRGGMVPSVFFLTLFWYMCIFPLWFVSNISVIWAQIADAPECAREPPHLVIFRKLTLKRQSCGQVAISLMTGVFQAIWHFVFRKDLSLLYPDREIEHQLL